MHMNYENIIFAIVVLFVIYMIVSYNKFIALKALINASWSDIEVQLKRRYNLIPLLVEAVKGYMDYESELLEKVVEARYRSINAYTQEDKQEATSLLTSTLGNFFAKIETYPDLKANSTLVNLQLELSNMESAIQNARRYYNASVRDYNTKVNTFPDLVLARLFHFEPYDYFEIIEDVKNMPQVDL